MKISLFGLQLFNQIIHKTGYAFTILEKNQLAKEIGENARKKNKQNTVNTHLVSGS